ncbi:ESPR-type extended signal peptide-containing protein, partial [Actinobacillus pleuropneumoniae]
MNKIFKVIWSHATQTFVVVSELTRSKSKAKASVSDVKKNGVSSLITSGFKLSVISSLLISVMPSAYAAVAIGSSTNNIGTAANHGGNAITIGDNSGNQRADGYISDAPNENEKKLNAYNKQKVSGNDLNNTVALGTYAYAYGHDSIAIGTNSQAVHNKQTNSPLYNSRNSVNAGAVAIGFQAVARGDQTVSLGSRAAAYNRQATAIGNDSYAMGVGSVVIGGDDSSYTPENPTLSKDSGYIVAGGFNPSKESNASWYRPSAASGNGATVVGVHSQALSKGSTALGVAATAGDGGKTSSTINDGQIVGIDSTQNIEATAIGALAHARDRNTTAVGHAAKAYSDYSTSIGDDAVAEGKNSSAVGKSSYAKGDYSVAIGNAENTTNTASVNATKVIANGLRAIAIGTTARTDAPDTIAFGTRTESTAGGAISIGYEAKSKALDAIAIGKGAKALNTNTISIGTGNTVNGANSGAIGDPTVVNGTNSYSVGNNNTIDSNNTFVLGNSVKLNTNAKNSTVIGNQNTINLTDVATNNVNTGYVNIQGDHNTINAARGIGILGNENTVDGVTHDVFILGNNVKKTANDSVFLGSGSGYVAEDTTTKGLSKTYTSDTVNGKTVNFAGGEVTAGVVSVGGVNEKGEKSTRRIQNVAPGLISDKSTDAINGSQLYAVTSTLDKGLAFVGDNGVEVNRDLGQTLSIVGNADLTQLSDKNIGIEGNKDAGQLVVKLAKTLSNLTSATFAEEPDAAGNSNSTTIGGNGITITTKNPAGDVTNEVSLTVNGLDNGGNHIVDVKGNLTPTYNVGDVTIGADGKPVLGQDGKPVESTTSTKSQEGLTAENATKVYNNAATVGDVLNAGWNLQGNGEAKDFVKAYDTVNFVNGANTLVSVVNSDDGKSNEVRVNVSGLPISYVNGTGDVLVKVGDKYYKATDVVDGKPNKDAKEQTVSGTSLVDGNGTTATAQTLANVASSIQNKGNPTDSFAKKLELAADEKDGTPNNAVNVSDLKSAVTSITGPSEIGGFGLKDKAGNGFKQALGTTAQITGDSNINTVVVNALDKDGKPILDAKGENVKALQVGLANDITLGKPKDLTDPKSTGEDGSIKVQGANGSAVAINGKDGSIGLTGPKGTDGKDGVNATIAVAKGPAGVDGTDGKGGKDGMTRIVYTDPKGTTHNVSTLNDGLQFAGNNANTTNIHKLNTKVNIVGEGVDEATSANFTSASGNINVKADGNATLTIQLAKTLSNLTSATFGSENSNTTIGGNGVTITPKGGDANSTVSLTDKGLNNGNNTITNVAPGVNGTDAVNKDQLDGVNATANAGWNLTTNGDNTNASNVAPNSTVDLSNTDGNIVITKAGNNVTFDLNNNLTVGGPGKDGKDGVDGQLGVQGKDGKTGVTLNGKDGAIGINGKDGSNGSITVKQGKPGVDGKDGETKTRIVYNTTTPDGKPVTEEVATLKDGLKFVGNDGKVVTKELNETLAIKGGINTEAGLTAASDRNVGVRENEKGLNIVIAERPTFSGITVDGKDGKDAEVKFAKDGKDGMSIVGTRGADGQNGLTLKGANGKDGVSFKEDGRITNVADGKDGKDAVNKDQLERVNATANAGWKLTINNGNNQTTVTPNATVDLANTDGNIVITKVGNNVNFGLNNTLTVGNDNKPGTMTIKGENGKDGVSISGKDGIGIKGENGQDAVSINGKDGNGAIAVNGKDGKTGVGLDGANGTIGINGKDGSNGTITLAKGEPGVDGKDGKTRIVYETKTPDGKTVTEEVATLKDGLKFVGDDGKVITKELNETLTIKGNLSTAADVTDKNLRVDNVDNALIIKMARTLTDLTNATFTNAGGDKSVVDGNGLTITPSGNASNTVSLTTTGLNNGDNKVINVAAGDVNANSTDAVNGSQLYAVSEVANKGWNIQTNGSNTTNVK